MRTIALTSWKHFFALVNEEFIRKESQYWRGQADADWLLMPTFDRFTTTVPRAVHLRRFKEATRGRRGPNPPTMQNENEWWALGQHHGLATPLLDWTRSPFVALYFAFVSNRRDTGSRAVFALDGKAVSEHNRKLASQAKGGLEFVNPHSDENARLVSQQGVFSRAPDGQTVEEWAAQTAGDPDAVLTSMITIPNKGRDACLLALNSMNINHLSLFPDLDGASQHCNHRLTIAHY